MNALFTGNIASDRVQAEKQGVQEPRKGKYSTFSRVRLLYSFSSPDPSGAIHFGKDRPDIFSPSLENLLRTMCNEDTKKKLPFNSWYFKEVRTIFLILNIKSLYKKLCNDATFISDFPKKFRPQKLRGNLNSSAMFDEDPVSYELTNNFRRREGWRGSDRSGKAWKCGKTGEVKKILVALKTSDVGTKSCSYLSWWRRRNFRFSHDRVIRNLLRYSTTDCWWAQKTEQCAVHKSRSTSQRLPRGTNEIFANKIFYVMNNHEYVKNVIPCCPV